MEPINSSTGTWVATVISFVAACASIVAAVISKRLVAPLSKRDEQDQEVEWRNHAIELTKLDIEARLKTRDPADLTPIRSSVLDFLANYRDLQELGTKTPTQLYDHILRCRTSPPAPKKADWRNHALELTKLDIEAKLKTSQPADHIPIRSPILDFLANYRDLHELGTWGLPGGVPVPGDKTPNELHQRIFSEQNRCPK